MITIIRRISYVCLFFAVATGPWVLLLLAAATGNWWVFIAPMTVYAAVITLAVCVRSAQISRRQERDPWR